MIAPSGKARARIPECQWGTLPGPAGFPEQARFEANPEMRGIPPTVALGMDLQTPDPSLRRDLGEVNRWCAHEKVAISVRGRPSPGRKISNRAESPGAVAGKALLIARICVIQRGRPRQV